MKIPVANVTIAEVTGRRETHVKVVSYHGRVKAVSWSCHGRVKIVSRSCQDRVKIVSWSCHGLVKVMSLSCQGDFIVKL